MLRCCTRLGALRRRSVLLIYANTSKGQPSVAGSRHSAGAPVHLPDLVILARLNLAQNFIEIVHSVVLEAHHQFNLFGLTVDLAQPWRILGREGTVIRSICTQVHHAGTTLSGCADPLLERASPVPRSAASPPPWPCWRLAGDADHRRRSNRFLPEPGGHCFRVQGPSHSSRVWRCRGP